jgi:phospholipase C
LNRRTFLTGAAGVVTSQLVRGANNPIKHIIFVMSENRSFDHMLGWFPNADGKQKGLSYLDSNGVSHPTYHLAPDWTGCGHPDPDHSYDGGRTEYDNGKMDGFLHASTGNDTYCTGFYVEKDLPVLAALHRNFTTCDRYFASILAPTFPNRIFANAGQTDRLAARGGTPVGRVASAARSPARSNDEANAGYWTGVATKLEPGAAATLWAGRIWPDSFVARRRR